MATKLYQRHVPEGRYDWEYRDCGPVAFATAFAIPYTLAHAILKKHGRQNRRGTFPQRTMHPALRSEIANGNCKEVVAVKVTLGAFVRKLRGQKGRYLVHVRGHYTTIVDGFVLDPNIPRWRKPIIRLFKVVDNHPPT